MSSPPYRQSNFFNKKNRNKMADDYRGQASLPRGIRNNNPGNIKYDGTVWQGNAGNDGTFVVFADIAWGVRALAKALTHMINNGTDSVTAIINQWAPPSENDTPKYVASVVADTGLDATATLTADDNTLGLLIRAIANHENGDNISAEYLSDQDIADGLTRLNNGIVSAAQAAVVYAQVDPTSAMGILLVFGFGIYYATRSWKYRKKI